MSLMIITLCWSESGPCRCLIFCLLNVSNWWYKMLLVYFLFWSSDVICMNCIDLLSSLCRKSFQSLEQLSADMSLSQTSLEPSHTLSLEARLAGTQWRHQSTSPSCCSGSGPRSGVSTNHMSCLIQIKRRLLLSEACAAPSPPWPATSLWPAWGPASVWPVLRRRSAARGSLLHREWWKN